MKIFVKEITFAAHIVLHGKINTLSILRIGQRIV